MNTIPAFQMQAQAHSGRFIRQEVLTPLGLSVTAAAQALRVTCAALSTLLNERASLSPNIALWAERAFGARTRNSYDIVQAKKRAGEIDVAPGEAPSKYKLQTPYRC